MGAKQTKRFFDEMHVDGGDMRPAYQQYGHWLHSTPNDTLSRKHDQADLMFRRLGITFTVYSYVQNLLQFGLTMMPSVLSGMDGA